MKRLVAAVSAIAIAQVFTAVTATPAHAAESVSVRVEGNNVIVDGTSGPDSPVVTNDCYVEGAQCTEVIGEGMAFAAPCVQTGSFSVVCPTPGAPVVNVNLGAGNDTFWSGGASRAIGPEHTLIVDAGPGNDILEGAGAVEIWKLGDGDDQLKPDQNRGPHVVGPDDISGGAGNDYVDYLNTAGADLSGLTISFDNVANDGSVLEGDVDNVRSDVERLLATNSNDTIIGNDLSQSIEGAVGDDTISGGGGDDTLDGGSGADTIDGGAGADTIYGGSDNDTIVGGPGFDTINGDTTSLLLTGNDVIDSVDSEPDYVACGPGSDTVNADYNDQIAAQAQDTCEQVTQTQAPVEPPAPTQPPAPEVPPTTTAPPAAGSMSIAGKVLDANKKRKKASIKITCAATTPCTGTAVAKKDKTTLAKGAYTVQPGASTKVSLKLTKKARALLRRSKTVKKVTLTMAPEIRRTVKLTR